MLAASPSYGSPRTEGDVNRAAVHLLDQYHRARMAFVSGLADLASNAEHVESLQSLGAMALLRPLLQDSLPAVQNAAILALGRLANSSEEWARDIVQRGLLPGLVMALGTQHRQQRKAATFALKAVARHPMRVQDLLEAGAIPSLAECLVDPNPTVKETASSALGHIGRCSEDIANRVIDTGALRLMTLNLQDPDVAVQRMSLSAIGDIARHSGQSANQAREAGAVAGTVALLSSSDERVKRQAIMCLGQIVKHDEPLAQAVVESEGFISLLSSLAGKGSDDSLKRGAAGVLRDIVRHSPELAWKVNGFGAAGPLIDFVAEASGHHKLPGITALGYMASQSGEASLAIIVSKGVKPLVLSLAEETDVTVRSAAAWALGQLGAHGPGHARSVANEGGVSALVDGAQDPGSSENFREKCRKGLLTILENLMHVKALVEILQRDNLSLEILDKVLERTALVLGKDSPTRAAFDLLGGFSRSENLRKRVLQARKEALNGQLYELEMFWASINDHFDTIASYKPVEKDENVEISISEGSLTNSLPARKKGLVNNISLRRERSKSITVEGVLNLGDVRLDKKLDGKLVPINSVDLVKKFENVATPVPFTRSLTLSR